MADKIECPFSTHNISCTIFQQAMIGMAFPTAVFIVLWATHKGELNARTKFMAVSGGISLDKVFGHKGQYPRCLFFLVITIKNEIWKTGTVLIFYFEVCGCTV